MVGDFNCTFDPNLDCSSWMNSPHNLQSRKKFLQYVEDLNLSDLGGVVIFC